MNAHIITQSPSTAHLCLHHLGVPGTVRPLGLPQDICQGLPILLRSPINSEWNGRIIATSIQVSPCDVPRRNVVAKLDNETAIRPGRVEQRPANRLRGHGRILDESKQVVLHCFRSVYFELRDLPDVFHIGAEDHQ